MSDDDYGDDTFEDEASPSTSQPTRPRKPAGRGSTGSRGRPASTRDKLRAINDEQSNRGERGGRSTVKDRLRALNAEADGRSERSGAGDGMSALLSAAADGSGRKNGEEDSDARSNADGGGKSGAAPGRYDDVDTGVPLSKMLVDDKHRTPTPNAPDEQLDPRSGAGDNTLTPCIYTLELLPRISIHNEIIQAFLSGDTKLGSRMLATAEPDTFTELVDSHGRTVAHYAAFHNQYLVLDAMVRQSQAVVETTFVERLKQLRLAETQRKAQQHASKKRLDPEQERAHSKWLTRQENALERLYHLALERALIDAVTTSDNEGRTLLHYAACSRGLSVERLLDTGAGGDFTARAPSGAKLFPARAFLCPDCGELVKSKRTPAPTPTPTPTPSRLKGAGAEVGGGRSHARATPVRPRTAGSTVGRSGHAGSPTRRGRKGKGQAKGRGKGVKPRHSTSSKARPGSLASKLMFRRRVGSDDDVIGASNGLLGHSGVATSESLAWTGTVTTAHGDTLVMEPTPKGASAGAGAGAGTGTGAGAGRSMGPRTDASVAGFGVDGGYGGADGAGIAPPPLCGKCHTQCVSTDAVQSFRQDVVNMPDMQGGAALHYASASGDVRACKSLLRHGANRSQRDSHGDTPLQVAAHVVVRKVLVPLRSAVLDACEASSAAHSSGAPSDLRTETTQEANEALRTLVACGEDINERTGAELRAPLHLSAVKGEAGVVRYLLSVAARVDVMDANGWSPLHCASRLGTYAHHLVARLLLDHGADPNLLTNGSKTPLHFAAMQTWAGTATAGKSTRKTTHSTTNLADVDVTNARSRRGSRPSALADVAAEDADTDIGARANNGGIGDEDAAGKGGSHQLADAVGVDMIKLLVQKGADLEARDAEGYTPLHWACRKGRVQAAHCLLSLGADLYATNLYGSTALHLAIMHNHLDVAHLLVRRDCETGILKQALDCRNRRASDYCSSSAARAALNTLFEASAAGMLDLVQQMLRASQETSAQVAQPWLPAYQTIGVASVALKKLMKRPKKNAKAGVAGVGLTMEEGLIYGAEWSDVGKGMLKVEKQYALVARLLLKYLARVDEKDTDGVTPLMLAAKHDLRHLLLLLMNKGADIHAQDNNGNTALHYAYSFGQTETCNLLEARQADPEMTNMDGVSAKEMAGSEGRNMQSYARRFRRRARRIASKVGQKSKR